MTEPFPERPKGMHEWAYTRLALRALAAEVRASNTFLDEFGKPKRATSTEATKEERESAGGEVPEADAVKKNGCFTFDLDVTPSKADSTGASE